jgi:hypothetical protein
MKRTILILLLSALVASCSSDDDAITEETGNTNGVIRITEVNTDIDEITIANFGDGAQDIGAYWLCLGPGTYVQVSNATSGSTNLNPNQSITLSYDVNPTSGGLSLFSVNTFGSTDPDVLIDYVQWGSANQARVNQAVTAGRWNNAEEFVTMVSPYTFSGSATEFGATFWQGTEAPAGNAVIRISTVNTATDTITLTNLGNATLDIANYWLCLGPGTYVQVTNAANGSTNLEANQSVTLSYDVNPSSGGLSVFTTNTFGSTDPDVLIDYVQWGSANQARVNQAVTAGRWDNAANIASGTSPFNFNGAANNFGSSFWN